MDDHDLQAWADGQLPPERHAAMQAWLAAHPDDAQRVAEIQALNAALRGRFDPVLDEPLPARLRALARRRPVRWPVQAAALIASLALGGVLGWQWHGAPEAVVARAEEAEFARRAQVAHAVFTPDQRRAVEVDGQEALVKWLSKRLGAPMRAPVLTELGYRLEGGRLLPGGQGPVAQFMYRDDAGARLTLYVTNEPLPAQPRAEFRYLEDGALKTFYWIDGGFGYAISAGADRRALAAVAALVHEQLKPAAPASGATN